MRIKKTISQNMGSSPLGNQYGFVFGVVLFALALVGVWFLYQSYKLGQLQSNIRDVANDYLSILRK